MTQPLSYHWTLLTHCWNYFSHSKPGPKLPKFAFLPIGEAYHWCKTYKRLISNFNHSPCGVLDHQLCCCVYGYAPQIYLSFKHKKLRNLVTAVTLQRLPISEAMSAFEIPTQREAKLVCQDPWVSIAVTTITIIGVVVYLYKACNRMPFF